jgi:hypothetical protein
MRASRVRERLTVVAMAAMWSPHMLFELAMAQAMNKVELRPLDLDLGVVASSIG